MREMGLKKDSNILIQSSWDEFYNYEGTIENFIDAVLNEIGENGTLAMPALPLLLKPDSIFSIQNTPTEAGMIAETFRNYQGVKRSVNKHSVCAIGPKSEYLLDEHQYSTTCWDEKSPYYKLSKINALAFSLGLGKRFTTTSIHCVESVLRKEIPYFGLFFQKKTTLKVRLCDKSIYCQEFLTSSDDFDRYLTGRSQLKIVKKYFDKSKYSRRRISNLTVNAYDLHYFISRMIELGRRGVVSYIRPAPSKKYFLDKK
jgi:aminoglycoside 3-N-acetyltransferase